MTARQHGRTASVLGPFQKKKKKNQQMLNINSISALGATEFQAQKGENLKADTKISVQLLSSILKYLLVPPKFVFYLSLFPVEMHLLLQSKFKLHDNVLTSYLLQSTKK